MNKSDIFCEGLSDKTSSASYFFQYTWKLEKCSHFGKRTLDRLINTTLLPFNCHLVWHLYLNIKYKIILFETNQMQPFCHISVSQGNALEILKIVEIAISKRSRQSYEVKFIFSDKSSQNMLRQVYKIKQSRAFMESLIPEFGQFSQIFVFRSATDNHAMSVLNFEILLNFLHFLGC